MRTTRQGNPAILVGIVFFVVGLGALAIAVWLAMDTRSFVAGAARTQGTVIAVEAGSSGGDSSPTYHPTVRFTDAGGKEVTFTSSTGTNPPSHREGDSVTVLYEPGRPQHAEIDSFVDIWLAPLIAGVFGVVFPLVGLAAMAGGLRAAILRRRLRANGQRIMAEVQGVESGVAGSGPGFTIVARATDPRGIQRLFRSPLLMADPGPALQNRKTVDVIVDPDDYATYEIDLAFLG
ncbi:MAG: hypothetical protein RL272_345 [Candidatus Parcubacteria bacterium]|jgi:hypothetical protein